MSYVTDVILISHYLELDTISKINSWFIDRFKAGLIDISEYGGGNKVLQCEVYAGAFNYLDLEAFLAFVKTLPPEDRECMQLLTSEEHDDKFTLQEI